MISQKKLFQLIFLLILNGLFFFTSCKKSKTRNEQQTQITVTIEPLRYLTEQIGGPYLTVKTFVPKGLSPETYEPTPQQLVDLQKSKIYFAIGELGFEKIWLKRLKESAPDTKFIRVDSEIKLIDTESESHKHTSHVGHHHGIDPHIWTTPQTLILMAKKIYEALIDIRPDLKDTFSTRYDQLKKEMEQTHVKLSDEFKASGSQQAFLIYHPTLSYFAETYGLKQIVIEEQGKSPAPSQLKKIIEECKKENVQIIFVQQEFDQRNAEIIARETDTKIVRINPLDYNWEKETWRIVRALTGKN